jgi:hypothetical protein
MGIPNLPLDVWFTIIEHLSLSDLAAVYDAMRSSPNDGSTTTKRAAIKVTSKMLATGTPRGFIQSSVTTDHLSNALSKIRA